MAKVTAIAQPTMAMGLGLTGVRVEEVQTVREAEHHLEELLGSDAEAVLVQEDFRAGFSEYMQRLLARHTGRPLVIYCPSFQEPQANTDAYINAILKPAVGFEIRLD